MKDQLVSFETAKLAKEKGFEIKTEEYYSSKTKVVSRSYNEYSAPTQSLLQKWLREKHRLFMTVNARGLANEIGWFNNLETPGHKQYHKTYEAALEVGLLRILSRIKQNKKT